MLPGYKRKGTNGTRGNTFKPRRGPIRAKTTRKTRKPSGTRKPY